MTKSASNLIERRPVQGKGKAGGSGHNGAALAAVLIHDAEEKAKRETAEGKTLKERLGELVLLSFEDHKEFRKAMVERQGQVEAAAKSASMSITLYRTKNPESNTIYNACSEWKRLSEACEAGYKPDMSLNWNEIKGFATAYLDKSNRDKAAAEKAPELVAERNKILAMKKVSDEKRAELLAPVESKIAEAIKEVYKPRARTSAKRKEAEPAAPAIIPAAPALSGQALVDQRVGAIITQLRNEPVPVVLGVAKWLESFIASEDFQKRVKAVESVTSKSGRVLTENQQKAARGVIGEEKPHNHMEEMATASKRGTGKGHKPSNRK